MPRSRHSFPTRRSSDLPVAILVNNAGSVASGAFAKADASVFQAMWDVHVMGAVHATQAVLPGMIERGFGRIVNVASTAGRSEEHTSELQSQSNLVCRLL